MLEPLGFQLVCRLFARYFNDDENLVIKVETVIEDFYKAMEKDLKNRKLLLKRITMIESMIKIYTFINMLTFATPTVTSLILSYVSNEYIMFVPFSLPFTDSRQTVGFAINEIAMSFYSVMFFELLIQQDLCFIYFTMQVIPMSDIFIQDLKKVGKKLEKYKKTLNGLLNQRLNREKSYKLEFDKTQIVKIYEQKSKLIFKSKSNAMKNRKSITAMEEEVINNIKQFNSYNNYISMFQPYIYMSSFVAIFTNAIGIGLSIVVAKFFSISIGVSVISILTLQVLMPCLQGTIISHQNQKILNEVNGFPWYKMSIKMQKVWVQFIHQCQNANELEIMFIGVLNMECFKDVMNGAYSYFMYVLNFLN